jgi:tetratricopeptide (TPR) repeat protein
MVDTLQTQVRLLIASGNLLRAMNRLQAIRRFATQGHTQRVDSMLALVQFLIDTTVERHLDYAQRAYVAAHFALAEYHVARALDVLTADAKDRKGVEEFAKTIATTRQQVAGLDEIERILDDGKYDVAANRLKEIVPNLTEGRLLERAQILWARSHPGRLRAFNTAVLSWLSEPIILLLLILLGLVGLLQLVMRAVKWRENEWTMTEITDSTGQGFAQLIPSYWLHWTRARGSSVTTGLLVADRSRIPTTPEFVLQDKPLDLAKAFEDVSLTVGALNVGVIARVVGVFLRWWRPNRQEVHGLVYQTADKRLVAQLTASQYLKQGFWSRLLARKTRPVVASAWAEGNYQGACEAVAKEVTFKVLYVIANRVNSEGGDHAAELIKGLDQLRAYIAAIPVEAGAAPLKNLEEAHKTFERVRSSSPQSLDAYLYEGIALDLLERHEEAIAHFEYVKQALNDQKDKPMYLRAAYNEAVAHLRNLYQYEGIEKCIVSIDELVQGREIKVEEKVSPLLALARAVQADAIACRTIPWKRYYSKRFGDVGDGTDPENLRRVIEECDAKVKEITGELRPLLKRAAESKGAVWDDDALRQLEWAIYNAEGDLNVYSVVAMDNLIAKRTKANRDEYLDLREITLLAGSATQAAFPDRSKRLEDGLVSFRHCEMLLPAGVETLSNLGTLFLFRGKPGDLLEARRYFGRVLDLNPKYEYAYYRLAQCWEMEGLREKVIDVLKKFPKPPGISSFQQMFRAYYVKPRVSEDSSTSAAA